MIVRIAQHLRRFVDIPDSIEIEADDMRQLLDALEREFPGVKNYLVHENGRLRQHVNIFVDGKLLTDRSNLAKSLTDVREVHILQALSGG